MPQQGRNVNVVIYRAENYADDEAGGAQRRPYAPVTANVNVHIRARIQARPATLEMRSQGLGADRFFDAAVRPATIDVERNDLLVPSDGKFLLQRFLVTGVIQPGMRLESPRAHLKLQLERFDEGKVIELL